MSNTRHQIAKMCIFVEEVFSNDLIVTYYEYQKDRKLVTIFVDYPLHPDLLLFSFVIPEEIPLNYYVDVVMRLQDDIKELVQKGAKIYGYE